MIEVEPGTAVTVMVTFHRTQQKQLQKTRSKKEAGTAGNKHENLTAKPTLVKATTGAPHRVEPRQSSGPKRDK